MFNARRQKFSDPRIREALGLAFDFEWTNRNIMYSAYRRLTSFFENSDMKAQGNEAPANVQTNAAGEWLVPVVRGVAFNSDAEIEAYLVADNRLTILGGWNEPGEAIKVLVTPDSVRDIRGYLAHEYAHVATFVHGPNATDAPWLVLEGIAELASANYRPGATEARQRTVAAWAAQDQLAPWEAIAPFPLKPEDEQYYRHVYTQGEDMLAWQTEQFGAQARNAFVASVCKGDSLDVASTKAFGKPWAAIDASWRNAAALLVKPEPENAP
jgi:hypothetical protein